MKVWGGRAAQMLTAQVLAEKGTRCHLCGAPGADTADHVITRSRGGADTIENLEPAHGSCNFARQDKTMAEWWAQHPLPTRPQLAPSRQW